MFLLRLGEQAELDDDRYNKVLCLANHIKPVINTTVIIETATTSTLSYNETSTPILNESTTPFFNETSTPIFNETSTPSYYETTTPFAQDLPSKHL